MEEHKSLGQCLNIDAILAKLYSFRNLSKLHKLEGDEVYYLIQKFKPIVQCQPSLLELAAPVKVVGDIHGQYEDLLRLFDLGGQPGATNYLFLGDYVDRGEKSIECMCLLMALKIKYPEKMFLLRGNHEEASINKIYGFFDECKRRYEAKMWKAFVAVFNLLPISALIDKRILCFHGGLSPDLYNFNQIKQIKRPTELPEKGLVVDLLWADPERAQNGWAPNEDRSISYTFGVDVVERFTRMLDIDLIVRAHQVVEDGYEFFANKKLVTIFSAPSYCGDYDNAGAIMSVDADLICSFDILHPKKRTLRYGSR